MAVDITKVLIDGTFEGRTNPAGLYRLCDVFEVNANVDDPCGCTYTICLNDEGATNGQVLTFLGNGTFGWTTVGGGVGGITAVVEDTSPQLGGNLDLNTHDITGTGSINITGNIEATGYGDFGNIRILGNTISSTDTNGNINLTPNGNGRVVIDGLSWPLADGTNGQVLTTNGAGILSWTTVGGGGGFTCSDLNGCSIDSLLDVVITAPVASQYLTFNGAQWINTNAPGGGITAIVQDTNPNLGGNLNVNGFSIVSSGGADININASGSGTTKIEGISYPNTDGTANQLMGTNGAGQIQFGNITLTAGSNISFNTGSPTTLGLGSNVTISSTAPVSTNTWSDYVSATIFEDFLDSVTTALGTTSYGMTNFRFSAANNVVLPYTETGHPGIVEVAAGMSLTKSIPNANSFWNDSADYIEFLLKIPTHTAFDEHRVGINLAGTDVIEFKSTSGNVWSCVTNVGAGITTTLTAVAVAGWQKLKIKRVGVSNIQFYIDNVLVATHLINVPSTIDGILVKSSGIASCTLYLDVFKYQSIALSR